MKKYWAASAVLSAALICSGTSFVSVSASAEDLIEEMDQTLLEDPEEEHGGAEIEENIPDYDQPEDTFDEAGDDVDLLEDSEGTVSVREGDLLEDVLEEEAREMALEEAQQKLEERMERELWMPALPSEEKMEECLEALSGQESPTGSDGELLLSRYLHTRLEEMGYTVSEQSFHEGFLNEEMVDVPGINLIAERGADTEDRNRKILILCTHYDSKTSPEEEDPLANDKSGAVVLLETARLLAGAGSDVDLCFLFLSGEEDGGYGAQAFTENLSEELRERICGVIFVDQTGYVCEGTAPAYVLATQDGESNEPADMLGAAAGSNQIQPIIVQELVDDTITENEEFEEYEEYDAFAEEDPVTDPFDVLDPEAPDGWSLEETPNQAERENFSVIMTETGGRVWFDHAGIPAVTIMQDLEKEEVFPEDAGNEVSTEGDESDEGLSEETEMYREEIYEEETESQSDEWKPVTLDLGELRWITNIVAQTAALYMQSAQI